ncbi:hypothetical protein [Embleya sp. MST-111070]|uniref:hypothetical protein n=1 Tax=Embleya sp. MST-111070 TaxID=3398231 RepID=UPI003F733EA1
MGPVDDARRQGREIEQIRFAEERERLRHWGIDSRRGVQMAPELAAFAGDMAGRLSRRKLESLFLHVDTREERVGLFSGKRQLMRVFESVGKAWQLATFTPENGSNEHSAVLSPDGRLFEARRLDALFHRGILKGGGLALVPTRKHVVGLTPDLQSLLLDYLDSRTVICARDPYRIG